MIGLWFMVGLGLMPALKFRPLLGFMLGSGCIPGLKFRHGL